MFKYLLICEYSFFEDNNNDSYRNTVSFVLLALRYCNYLLLLKAGSHFHTMRFPQNELRYCKAMLQK